MKRCEARLLWRVKEKREEKVGRWRWSEGR